MRHVHVMSLPKEMTMLIDEIDVVNKTIEYAVWDGLKRVREYTKTPYDVDSLNPATTTFDGIGLLTSYFDQIIAEKYDF